MTRLALQVSSKIVEMVKQDKLVLPTLPEIALRVRDVAEDPNSSVKDIANIISRDPALTARIIKVTNSPMIRSSKPINDIFAAVTRLGVAYTSNIAIGLAMEQMFQATSDVIDSRLRRTWAQALQVGASAEVLARHFTNISPEKAMLAGIVHQIGVLPILAFAENNDELLSDSESLDIIIRRLHPSIGTFILRHWGFDPDIIAVPKQHLMLDREGITEPDLADLVQVAMLQSHVGSNHRFAQIDQNKLGSFQRLGLVVDEEISVWDDLSEEIEATGQAFKP